MKIKSVFAIFFLSLFLMNTITVSASSDDESQYVNGDTDIFVSLNQNGDLVYKDATDMEKEVKNIQSSQKKSRRNVKDISYGVVNFRTKSSASINTTYTEDKTGTSGYLNGYYGSDGAFLGYNSDKTKVKFKMSGVTGWVDATDVELINYNDQLSVSCYWAENGKLYHYVAQNIKQTDSYFSTNYVGKKPEYLVNNVTYYSYDGHYFYSTYNKMIDDYKQNSVRASINASSPYYNYFQYLPYRSKTSFAASDFNAYTSSKVSSGKLLNLGSSFIENQNLYGANAALIYGTAVMESGWGTSQIAMDKNNLFGHGAVDSNPYWGANGYNSASESILYHAKVFISEGYCDPLDYSGRYFGSHLGDKESGINVKYASDPYWGEKIASICWYLEDYSGKTDSYRYTIGIKDGNKNIGVYTNPGSNLLYQTNVYGHYPFIILSEENSYYRVQSDPTLNATRTKIIQDSGEYNFNQNYGYISKNNISYLMKGQNSTLKNQWYQDYLGRWYWYNDKGVFSTGWQKINNTWYYFDNDGVMLTGWQQLNNAWYYLDTSGAMRTGWIKLNNIWYYLDSSGKMLTGRQTINNKEYYFNSSGSMVIGWKLINQTWYYFDASGAMKTGWINLNSIWYYLDSSGKMLTGRQTIKDKEYYLNASGAMVTGWVSLDGKYYYFDASGAMAKDTWVQDYYVDQDGVWIQNRYPARWIQNSTGWWYRHEDGGYTTNDFEQIGDKTYYFNNHGYMVTGWKLINQTWYYFDANGAMQMGWKYIGGSYYYFNVNGAMLADTWIQGYYVNQNGAWVQ